MQILRDPSTYATNFLYTYGDIFYFMNSILYLLSCLRDDGWFWFMPVAGEPRPVLLRNPKYILSPTSYGRAQQQRRQQEDEENTLHASQARLA